MLDLESMRAVVIVFACLKASNVKHKMLKQREMGDK